MIYTCFLSRAGRRLGLGTCVILLMLAGVLVGVWPVSAEEVTVQQPDRLAPLDPLASFMPFDLDMSDIHLLDNADISVSIVGDATINKCERKTYTYAIINQGSVPITSVVSTLHLVNLVGFDYVEGSASLDIDGAEFCTADPQVSGSDLIWDVDVACSGTYTLGVGETLNITVDLETDCEAVSGSLNGTIAYQRGVTSVSDNTAVASITVTPGAVNIRKTPAFAPGAVGDVVTFTIEVENTGLGTITNVEVTDTIEIGLAYPYALEGGVVSGQTQSWTSSEIAGLALMNPGEILSWDVAVRVDACQNLASTADVQWGCGPGATCYNTATDGGTAAAAVQRLARTPNITYVPPVVAFDYCDPNQTVTFDVSNVGDGPAYQVHLYAEMAGFAISDVSVGATYNAAQNRFELAEPIPSGDSYQLSYTLTRSNWCAGFDALTVVWQTEYLDSCDNLFYPPSHTSRINPPASQPSLSAELSGVASIIQFGESVAYTVQSAYSEPEACGSGNAGSVIVTDTVPAGWTVSSAGGGIWTPGPGGTGGTVVWSYLPPDSLDTMLVLDPPAVSECETYCYTSFVNQLEATGVDCCGCDLSNSDSDTTHMECEEGVDSTKTVSGPTERCDVVTYTNTYAFPIDSLVSLDELLFTEMADRSQEYVVGTLSIGLSGSGDITNCPIVTDTTMLPDGVLDVDFAPCADTPLAGQTLTVTYQLEITPDTAGACGNADFVSWSRMDLGSTAPGGCLQDGILYEGTIVSVQAPSMDLQITGINDVMSKCEPATVLITLTRTSSLAQPRDVSLKLSGLNYYCTNPAAVICSGDIAPTSCTPALVGEDYVWTFDDRFLANGDQAILEIPVCKRCSGGGRLTATAYYDDLCNDDTTVDETCSVGASDDAAVIVSGDLLIEVTPEQYLATTNQASWKVYVTNRGSGDAHSVWIDYVMGSGLQFVSVVPDNADGVLTTLSVDHNNQPINGGWTSISVLAAGTRRELTVLADLVACDNLTLDATTAFGCNGTDCQPSVSDNSSVVVPAPNLVTTNAVSTPMDACATATGWVVLRNAGPVTDYALEATITLPAGLDYEPGSTRWQLNSGPWQGPSSSYDPVVVGSVMTYDSTRIAALAALESGDEILMEYDLVADCPFAGGDVRVNTTYENPCGQVFNAYESVFAVAVRPPDVGVSITRADEPVGCNETVTWNVQITNNSGYDLPVVQVKNVFSDAWTYDSATTDWQGAYAGLPSHVDGQTVTWELANLTNGSTAQLAILATSDSAPCSTEMGHQVLVRAGCGVADGDPASEPGTGLDTDACLMTTVYSDLHESHREPDLTFASITVAPESIDACAESAEIILTIENQGPVDAQDLDLVLVLPEGLSYIAGSTYVGVGPSQQAAIDAMGLELDPAQSGAGNRTLTWRDQGDKGDDLAELLQAIGGLDSLALRFQVASSCFVPGDMDMTLYYYDCCGDQQYSSTDQHSLGAEYPSLTLTKTPATQQVDCGELITWTLSVANNGSGNAQIVRVKDTLGDWFDYVSSTPEATELAEQVYGWELSNLAVSGSQLLTITARLNPDSDQSCADVLRQNHAQAQWACGVADGSPATDLEYACESDWVLASAATARMPNLLVADIDPVISCLPDGTFAGSLRVRIDNQGDGDALSGFTVEITDGKGWTGWVTPTAQAAGTSQWYTVDTETWLPDCHACSEPYSFVATVDALDQVCECNEIDNALAEAYTTPIPELSVSDIDFTQVTCDSDVLGGVVQVRVANTACVDASNVRVRLETDGCLTFSDQTITLVGDQSSAVASFSVANWADCLDSTCVFTATVDRLGEICECDETNQQLSESWNLDRPDLIVTHIDTAGLTCVNDSVGGAITVTIQNQGFGFPTNVPVRLNSDGCLTLNDVTVAGPLGNGATAQATFTVSGDWGDCGDVFCNLTAIVDPDNAICECDGNNNALGSVLTHDLPNLYVASVTPLIVCDSDGPKTVNITVAVGNEGATAVNGAVVRLVSACGQTFVDQTVDLAPGATDTLTFSASSTSEHCTCDYTATIDPDNSVCECSSDDNAMSSGNYDSPVAELSIADIDFSNVTCASDSMSGNVRVQVLNTGCVTANSVLVRLETDGCLAFDDVTIPAIVADGSTWVTFAVVGDWADCTDAHCDFTASVDPLNTICEFTDTYNDRTETYSTTLPDLVVSEIDTSGIVCSGDSITGAVTVTVANQGFGAASNFEVSLATDGCLTFDNETVTTTLMNGQSTAVRFDITGDWADCSAASCLFTAMVDPDNDICECNGDNNQGQRVHTSNTADLVVNSVTPASDCYADAASGTIVVNVSNGGSTTVTNAIVRVTNDCGYAIPDQLVTLAAGTYQDLTFYWTPVGSTCDCVFTATIDPDDLICECSSDNNALAATSHQPQIPDLRVASDTITINCDGDGSIAVGGSLVVANDGCGAAFTGSIPVRVTLYDRSDCAGEPLAQWNTTLSPVNIASHGSQSILLPDEVLAVADQAEGCAISVEVELDPDNTICEYSGANNVYCVNKDNPSPDLTIIDQDLTLECLDDASATLGMRALVSNAGCVPAEGTAIIRYTLYSDAGCSGAVLGTWTRTAMLSVSAGGSQWVQVIAETLNGDLCDLAVSCKLSLRAEIDATDQVCELNGNNNAHCEDLEVDFADLLVSAVTYDSESPGQLQVDVANHGCGDATNVVVTVTADCGPIIQPQVIDLAAGEERRLAFTFDPPTCSNCECVFIAMIDGISQICECSETNNLRRSNQEPLGTELSMTKTTSRREVYIGETITYTLIVSNTGDATAGGVVISDELASGLEFVGPVVLDGSLGVVAQSADDLPVLASGFTIRPDHFVTVTLPVRVTGLGPIRNVAVAGTTTGVTPPTQDDEEILALALPTSMTGCQDPFCPGWTLRYSFWITNTLPEPLYDLVVWDELPAEVCCPSEVPWNSRPFELSDDERTVTWTVSTMEPGQVIRLGVGLHSYPNLPHGTLVTNTIRYQAERLGEARSETIVLHADTTICGSPQPTLEPTPVPTQTPGPGEAWLHMPLVLKD